MPISEDIDRWDTDAYMTYYTGCHLDMYHCLTWIELLVNTYLEVHMSIFFISYPGLSGLVRRAGGLYRKQWPILKTIFPFFLISQIIKVYIYFQILTDIFLSVRLVNRAGKPTEAPNLPHCTPGRCSQCSQCSCGLFIGFAFRFTAYWTLSNWKAHTCFLCEPFILANAT